MMVLFFRYRFLLAASILLCTFSFGAAQEDLNVSDVHRVMNQILQQQKGNHELSQKIIQAAIINYLNQFDPDKIYLLQNEVDKYKNLPPAELDEYLNEYKNNNYLEFKTLDMTIQRAILRARNLRKQLMARPDTLFQQNSLQEKTQAANPKQTFASTENDLKNRVENNIRRYISEERQHYGSDAVKANQAAILRTYDKNMQYKENLYLYQNDEGKPLPQKEMQNLFYMHVLKALASSFDSHTAFLGPDEAFDLKVILEKGFHGLGIILQNKPQGVVISRMMQDGPAYKSGLIHAGDQILKINGQNVSQESVQELVEKLRDSTGPSVDLVLKRIAENGESETFPVRLKREFIAVDEGRVGVQKVSFENGVIGILNLQAFYQGENGVTSANDLKKAIEELRSQSNLEGLILDFRDNGGGFLSQAIKVAGLFITNGVVAISKSENGEEHFFRDMEGKVSYKGPLIILTSKATASAAEIVAQALQDYGVALIVGDERTYGKGTIQSQTITDSNTPSHFKVTVGEYYTVSGKTPQLQGVKADVVVPGPLNNEHIGEEYLKNHLKPGSIPPSYKDPLTDVSPVMKLWYMEYYMPTIQKKELVWRRMIPALKAASAERVAHNPGYQEYLKRYKGDLKDYLNNKISPDYQLDETVNVMKDMIRIEKKEHFAH